VTIAGPVQGLQSQGGLQMQLTEGSKLEGLQALRGIAVLCVFFYHMVSFTNQVAPGPLGILHSLGLSAVGLYAFFGMSGFIITSKAGDPPARFILDRVRRIYPGYWISIVVGSAALWLVSGTWPAVDLKTILLISNGKPASIPVPYWSLLFEVHFYLLVLLIGMFARRYMAPILLLWGIATILLYARPIVFLGAAYPATYKDLLFAIYNIFFIAGAFAGAGLKPGLERAWWYVIPASLCLQAPSILNLLGWNWVWGSLGRYDVEYMLSIPGVFFAVRAALLWPASGLIGRILASFGNVSYGIYLFHLPTGLLISHFLMHNWHLPHWQVFIAVSVGSLAPTFALGMIDLGTQRYFKRLQTLMIATLKRRKLPQEWQPSR
jgi:peptidoglycan/LPS O-acetylase OafA/YrhL